MAKKTAEEIREDMKKAADTLSEKATTVVDAAKPAVEKARKAAAPAVKRAKEVGADAAKTVADAAKKAAPKKPEYYVQYAGREIDMDELAAQAKAAFKAENKRAAIMSCRIYLKPEDSAAYYVVNDTFFGKISL